jgi:hypothetical protein
MDITEAELRMIEQLKEALLIDTYTQIFRTGLKHLYQNTFKPYLQNKVSEKTADKPVTKKELVTGQVLDGQNICVKLGGTVNTEEDGTLVCEYITYTKAGQRVMTGINTCPLHLLTAEHIDKQFKGGTKDEILIALDAQEAHEKKGFEDLELGQEA